MYNFKAGDIVKFKKEREYRKLDGRGASDRVDKFHKSYIGLNLKIEDITHPVSVKNNKGSIILKICPYNFRFKPERFKKLTKIEIPESMFTI